MPYLEFLLGLHVFNGCVINMVAVLIRYQVLLQMVLSRTHKHHPVTKSLARKFKPQVLLQISVFSVTLIKRNL